PPFVRKNGSPRPNRHGYRHGGDRRTSPEFHSHLSRGPEPAGLDSKVPLLLNFCPPTLLPEFFGFNPPQHSRKISRPMLTAITRAVSPAIVNCELTFLERRPIDLESARAQHRAYEELLEQLGAKVISLPAEPALPDSMFVEDPALVLDELAVILPLGTDSRRPEAASLAAALSKFRPLAHITLPGTLEGGDILRIERKLYVGLTKRSNREGILQLSKILAPHNYNVIPVPVTGCLHLTSAVTYLGRHTLLIN